MARGRTDGSGSGRGVSGGRGAADVDVDDFVDPGGGIVPRVDGGGVTPRVDGSPQPSRTLSDEYDVSSRDFDNAKPEGEIEIEITEALKNGDISAVLDVNGKSIKATFSRDELKRISGLDDAKLNKMLDDVRVKDAATLKRDDLIKLGAAGSLAAFVVFLMLVTGKSNPIEAIAEALKAAAKTTADTGSDIFKQLFSGMGGLFNVSALFSFCSSLLLILYLVGSVFLKK